jgi:tRNA dimethylallyltransferase
MSFSKSSKKLDPERAKNIDAKNPRRLIRAIEIASALGQVPPLQTSANHDYDFKIIGLQTKPEELRKLIKQRLEDRLEHGLIEEVAGLKKSDLSWAQLENFGLEYRYVALYLQNKLSLEEMTAQLNTAIWHYAKRQLTWWKRDTRIQWLERTQALRWQPRRGSTSTRRAGSNPGRRQSRAKRGKRG